MLRAFVQAALLLACSAVCAAEAELGSVTVTTARDPVEKSYRKMLKGMDLFEEQHRLAPDASLRFKLLPRQHDTDMNGIQMNIIGETVAIPVRVAKDHTFTLERIQKALDEDASVIPNRKARSMTWRTEIRTPGLPADVRRLGDLRLECQVGMEADLVSEGRPFFGDIANFLLRMSGYCTRDPVDYLFFAERPLFGVTLVAGARREILPVERLYAGSARKALSKSDLASCDCQVMLDRAYYLPLGDPSWPDDTLVEFEYMDGGTVGKGTKAEVIAALGKTTAVRFDSGYEVWVYQTGVFLFDPSGAVVKNRVLQPNRP